MEKRLSRKSSQMTMIMNKFVIATMMIALPRCHAMRGSHWKEELKKGPCTGDYRPKVSSTAPTTSLAAFRPLRESCECKSTGSAKNSNSSGVCDAPLKSRFAEPMKKYARRNNIDCIMGMSSSTVPRRIVNENKVKKFGDRSMK